MPLQEEQKKKKNRKETMKTKVLVLASNCNILFNTYGHRTLPICQLPSLTRIVRHSDVPSYHLLTSERKEQKDLLSAYSGVSVPCQLPRRIECASSCVEFHTVFNCHSTSSSWQVFGFFHLHFLSFLTGDSQCVTLATPTDVLGQFLPPTDVT